MIKSQGNHNGRRKRHNGGGPTSSFEEWLRMVNAMTLAKHQMSIYELEDDIPREMLQRAFDDGVSAQSFHDARVRPLFYPDDEELP